VLSQEGGTASIQQSFVEHLFFTRHWGYKHAVDIVPAFQSIVCGALGRQVALVHFSKRYGGGGYRVLRGEGGGHLI